MIDYHYDFVFLAKAVKGLRLHPISKLTSLPATVSQGTGRRYETPGSETNNSTIYSNSSRQTTSICTGSLNPSSHRVMQSGLGDTCILSGLRFSRGALSFRS